MTDELKPCPFCGEPGIYVNENGIADDIDRLLVSCNDVHCMSERIKFPKYQWQSRPIEDALRAEIARLKYNFKHCRPSDPSLEEDDFHD